METFPEGFIRGLFQGMLSEDTAAPPHDLIQNFNRELNNLNDETALTALIKCDTRVYVCYGCSLIFLKMGRNGYHHLILSLLKSLDVNTTGDEVSSSSIKCIFSCFL